MAGGPFVVDFDAGAVHDLEAIKSKDERKALLNVVDKLMNLGPRLVPPHSKSLKGESGLFELRPRQGKSACRPICMRDEDSYVVLAIAKDHAKDFSTAIADAHARRKARSLT